MSTDLKRFKLARTQLRRQFTNSYNELDKILSVPDQHVNVRGDYMQLSDLADRLFKKDDEIQITILAQDEVDEDEYTNECDTVQDYRGKFILIKAKCEALLEAVAHTSDSSRHTGESLGLKSKRNFNLPKLELKKFDGNVKNWIGFWGQFKKINDDTDIEPEDKFQYLLQATVPGSSARELVESFPPSGENYHKAIDQLKSRFARDELLIEIYVRELLNLVLQQSSCNNSIPLNTLYDKLETQLRALETLGVTSDKYAAMLQPLVESALPEETLKVWERHRKANRSITPNSTESDNHASDNRLQLLLDFLRTEVEGEERVTLARTGFSASSSSRSNQYEMKQSSSNRRSKEAKPSLDSKSSLPTAATILTVDTNKRVVSRPSCLYCEKNSHSTQDCAGLHKLQLGERKEFIKKKGACFICLLTGHSASKCKVFVNCIFCSRKHYAVMCHDLNKLKTPENSSDSKGKLKGCQGTPAATNSSGSSQGVKDQSVLMTQQKSETLLQTLIVKVTGKGRDYLARVLLDSGSQRSYVAKDCVQTLGLRNTGEEVINHSLFGGVEMQQTTHSSYVITLKNLHTDYECNVPVLDQEIICNYVPRLTDEACFTILREKNIVLTDVGEDVPNIKILLGADVLSQLLTGTVEKLDGGLIAVETHLGWAVMGKQQNSNHQSLLTLFCTEKVGISDLWSLDVIGIRDPAEVKSRSHLEAEAVKHFKENVKINDENRYEVCLPWVEGHPKLLDNRELAEKRLLSVSTRLRSSNKFNDYDNVLKDWLKMGIIEKVPENSEPSAGHYLPHHAVVKESSLTTKIRPVFDASAKDKRGNSLNSCLEKGPNLVELIPSLLMRFRLSAIGVTADIEKAFLQISLSNSDRKFLQFLWWDDFASRKMTTIRHCRVVFGISSSPFLLGATIDHHLENAPAEFKETADKLKVSFYVDNCVTSVQSVDELNRFVEQSTLLMSLGKFNLRDWHFNTTNGDSGGKLTSDESAIVPVLGMLWDKSSDEIFCDVSSVSLASKTVTKRSLLSVAQRIFDVIGFTCPVSLIPKLLLQETWQLKLTWDEMLPHGITNKFLKWLDNVHWLDKCRLQRNICGSPIPSSNCTVHVFCDASSVAYAACIFLRTESSHETKVQLVSAKSRIAPMKQLTIPRLELLAAVIGSRLYTQVKEALRLENYPVYFWSDSMVALSWIKLKGDWNTFVGNRCREICKTANSSDWHYVPGEMNPADLPSRGCNGRVLFESRWWEGPLWLREGKDNWPQSKLTVPEEEVNAEKRKTVTIAVTTEGSNSFTNNLLYFSKYSSTVRMVAWMLRFAHNSLFRHVAVTGNLTNEEITEAEFRLIRCIQTEAFDCNSKTLKELQVFIDGKGIMRVKTKLVLSNDTDYYKYPILLPSKHSIVASLILEMHRTHHHAGVQTMAVILRENFWILRGRKTLRSVLSKCVRCKRFKVKAVETPSAPLPVERISDSNAFETTGIDLAGPLYLKNGSKAWVVLFTCAVYRAVHLELVQSLSAEAFVTALRRFIARRGRISTIFTDNGTNFVGTNNMLKNLDWDKIMQDSRPHRINWKFNPPSAPWWGGWWERLVRMVKELLRRNLGLVSVDYEELLTLLCDCESTLNSRPLTYLSDDHDELQPLTPSMFLQPIVRDEVTDLDKIDSSCLNKRVRYIQKQREQLRARFKKEYLSMLVHSGKRKKFNVNSINVGDVVLVGDENVKRIKWPLAVVLELFTGKDGVSRVARVRTGSGGELTRPVQRLYPLEVTSADTNIIEKSRSKSKSEKKNEESIKAKVTALDKMTRSGRNVKTPLRLDL